LKQGGDFDRQLESGVRRRHYDRQQVHALHGRQSGSPNIHIAIEKSCDGYFYRLGLKMKLEGIQSMVDMFDLDKRTGIDLA